MTKEISKFIKFIDNFSFLLFHVRTNNRVEFEGGKLDQKGFKLKSDYIGE